MIYIENASQTPTEILTKVTYFWNSSRDLLRNFNEHSFKYSFWDSSINLSPRTLSSSIYSKIDLWFLQNLLQVLSLKIYRNCLQKLLQLFFFQIFFPEYFKKFLDIYGFLFKLHQEKLRKFFCKFVLKFIGFFFLICLQNFLQGFHKNFYILFNLSTGFFIKLSR